MSLVHIEKLDNLFVCRISGEMTSYLLDALKHDLALKVKEEKIYRVLLNLEKVEYISSRDLGVFVQIFHFLESHSKRHKPETDAVLAFSNLSTFVKGIMELTRLQQIFTIYNTEEDAIEKLSGKD
jgi:anti-anti-sigma factor